MNTIWFDCLWSIYFKDYNLSPVDVYSFFLPFEQPYFELANSYSIGKIADLEAYVNTNAEKFESVGYFSYSSFIWSIWHWDYKLGSALSLTYSSNAL